MATSLSLSITQNSQSIANNTSNVTVKVTIKWTYGSYNAIPNQTSGYVTINGTKYTFSSTFNTGQTTSGSQTLYTKTVNVTHASNGTKTLACSAYFDPKITSGAVSCSGSKTLTTIPRKSTLSVANGTLGTAQTLKITELASSFKHKLKYTCGSTSGYILGGSSSYSTELSKSWAPSINLASQNTTGTSVSIKFTLYTYTSDGTSVGSNEYTKTFSIPSSVKPSCKVTCEVVNSFEGEVVQGYSKLKVTVTPTLSYSSPIASYSVSANGSKYTSASFTTGVLKSSGTNTITATVKDKRGRTSNSASARIDDVLAYSKPKITNLTVTRCDGSATPKLDGDHALIYFSASVTALNNKNKATYIVQYKPSGTSDDNYIDAVRIENNATMYSYVASPLISVDTGTSYDVRALVSDGITTTAVERNATIPTAFVLMHFKADGTAMAVGKISENSNTFEVGMNTVFSGKSGDPVKIEHSTDNVDTYYTAERTDTGTIVKFGVGSGGINHGVYSTTMGKWMVYSDGTDTRINGCRMADNKVLWSGEYYMNSSQSCTLSEAVNKQANGIVLVWSWYSTSSSEAQNQNFHHFFVPKHQVTAHPGTGKTMFLTNTGAGTVAAKYVYINNTTITGYSNNNAESATKDSGLTTTPKNFVLRYVIGV